MVGIDVVVVVIWDVVVAAGAVVVVELRPELTAVVPPEPVDGVVAALVLGEPPDECELLPEDEGEPPLVVVTVDGEVVAFLAVVEVRGDEVVDPLADVEVVDRGPPAGLAAPSLLGLPDPHA